MSINKTKKPFVTSVVKYIQENYKDKIKQIIVYGQAVDNTIKNPDTVDIAVTLYDEEDAYNFDMLGDILSFMGDITTEGDCSLIPMSDKVLTHKRIEEILRGETIDV